MTVADQMLGRLRDALDTGHQPCGGTGTHASITGGDFEPCECIGERRADGSWNENYELWETLRVVRRIVRASVKRDAVA